MGIPHKYAKKALEFFPTKVLNLVHGAFGRILDERNSPNNKKVISLKPKGNLRGNALLSYRIEGFLIKPGEKVPYQHQGTTKGKQIASAFLDLGYAVDIISNGNKTFLPQKEYAIFADTRKNFERLAPLLNKDCLKILYATTAHPHFNNFAELKRLMALQQRRHVTLRARRFMSSSDAMAIEYADCVVVMCEFGIQNFKYAKKPVYLVPSAVPWSYPWVESKDFENCRTRFLWLGSNGMVHKGLDLVLEAFARMPGYHLTVCGPVEKEKDFEQAYFQELYHTPNIHTYGWIDIQSSEFLELTNHCLGLVYPSCSESNAGSVLTCLHAGLLPIISFESGVDVEKDFGVILPDCSIEAIQEAVHRIAACSLPKLKQMSRKAWEFARANHTMENFTNQFKKVAEKIIGDCQK